MTFTHLAATAGAACAIAALAPAARAAYTITPDVAGSSTYATTPGSTFKLDFTLGSTGADAHNSAIFRVVFSEPGVRYTGYAWSPPHATGGFLDDSRPVIFDLPVIIDDATLQGAGYPPGVADVELSSVTTAGVFTTGLLVSMFLTIPADWSGPDQFTITVAPDTFANGFTTIPTFAGPGVTVTLPAAPTGAALALGCCIAAGRRRVPAQRGR